MTLARPASEIMVGDVFRKMETSHALVECFEHNGKCAIPGNCGLGTSSWMLLPMAPQQQLHKRNSA